MDPIFYTVQRVNGDYADLLSDGGREHSITTVSYTHLDVYKRQAFAADSFSEYLVRWFCEDLGITMLPISVVDTLSVIFITLILSYFTLVFGDCLLYTSPATPTLLSCVHLGRGRPRRPPSTPMFRWSTPGDVYKRQSFWR